MTFTLKLENNKILKGIIGTLSNIIDETIIKVNKDELTLSAFDPSRICIIRLSMKKNTFDEFKCKGEHEIGINLDDFNKILNRSSGDDSLILSYDPEEVKIKIQMENIKKKTRRRTFKLALLDLEIEDMSLGNLEKIEYDISWIMDPNFLIEAIKDAEIYSEIITIKAKEDVGLEFNSSGQIGEMNYELEKEELTNSQLHDNAISSYSILFIKNILTLASITKEMNMSLKQDHPLKILFTLDNDSEIKYFLAPRVEEEEYNDEDIDDIDDINISEESEEEYDDTPDLF